MGVPQTLIILKVDIWYFIGAAWELVSADSNTNTVTNADTNTYTNTDQIQIQI